MFGFQSNSVLSHTQHKQNAEGPDKSWPLEPSGTGYFFHRIEYIPPAIVNKHASTQYSHRLDDRPREPERVGGRLTHN